MFILRHDHRASLTTATIRAIGLKIVKLSMQLYRVEVSPEAFALVESEAFLAGRTMKAIASEILIAHCSKEAANVSRLRVHRDRKPDNQMIIRSESGAPTDSGQEHSRLKDDPAAIQKIKDLWKAGQHNQAEIARVIGYPRATTADNVRRMRKAGELEG